MRKLFLILLVTCFPLSGCTHKRVEATKLEDKNKTCEQLERDIDAMSELESNIDSKTGLSGRNIGMALLFWPGIIVNEMNADDARDRASKRKENLYELYDETSA